METLTVGVIMVVVLVVLVILKFPIGFAFLLIGFCGYVILKSWGSAFGLLPTKVFGGTASYLLTVVPLFILMGEIAFSSGIGEGLYKAFRALLGRFRGGLLMATTIANAAFGAACGMPEAATGVFGKLAMPEMLRHNTNRSFAAGAIVGSAGLSALIPPSVLAIIYGFLAVAPINKCLIAGILPGILTVLVYVVMINIRVRRNPQLAPPIAAVSRAELGRSLLGVLPMLAVVLLSIIGILVGLFTPTEGGGVGAAGVLIIAVAMRKISGRGFKDALTASGKTTSVLFIMVGGLAFFSAFLAVSGVSQKMTDAFVGLPVPTTLIIILTLFIFLGLGCIIGPFPLMYLTIPLMAPIMKTLGVDLIWYGVLAVKMATMGMITPPLGINCYMLRLVLPEFSIQDIFKGSIHYLLADVVIIALLVAFPQISLVLPRLMT